MKTCRACGEPITQPRRYRYCSDACMTRGKPPREPLGICPTCQGPVVQPQRGVMKVYCSRTCRSRAGRTPRNPAGACPVCGEPVDGWKRIYCSKGCHNRAGTKPRESTSTCAACGSPIAIARYGPERIYCSSKCKDKARLTAFRGEPHVAFCRLCGQGFIQWGTGVYCSDACRRVRRRAKDRAYALAHRDDIDWQLHREEINWRSRQRRTERTVHEQAVRWAVAQLQKGEKAAAKTLPAAPKVRCRRGHPLPPPPARGCPECRRLGLAPKPGRTKTQCKRGHPYDAVNTGVHSSGRRFCRACRREYARQRHARHRARGVAPEHLHGTLQGWLEYRCPCGACRESRRIYMREYKRRQRQRTSHHRER